MGPLWGEANEKTDSVWRRWEKMKKAVQREVKCLNKGFRPSKYINSSLTTHRKSRKQV